MEKIELVADKSQENIINKYSNILDFYSYYLQPYCNRVGLSLDQFWNDDPYLYFAYLEAYNEREKERFAYDNAVAHLQGQYTTLALAQVLQFSNSPKKIYPDEPFKLGETNHKTTAEESNNAWVEYLKARLK